MHSWKHFAIFISTSSLTHHHYIPSARFTSLRAICIEYTIIAFPKLHLWIKEYVTTESGERGGGRGGGRQEHWVYYERIALRIYYKYNRWMKKLLFALDGTSHSDSSNRKTYPIQPNTHTHAHTHIWNDDVGKKFN